MRSSAELDRPARGKDKSNVPRFVLMDSMPRHTVSCAPRHRLTVHFQREHALAASMALNRLSCQVLGKTNFSWEPNLAEEIVGVPLPPHGARLLWILHAANHGPYILAAPPPRTVGFPYVSDAPLLVLRVQDLNWLLSDITCRILCCTVIRRSTLGSNLWDSARDVKQILYLDTGSYTTKKHFLHEIGRAGCSILVTDSRFELCIGEASTCVQCERP